MTGVQTCALPILTEMHWEDSFVDSFSVNSSNVFPSSSSLAIK